MEYGAIDLHLQTSQIRIVDADGAVVWTGPIATTRAALTQVFAGRAPLRVLVESGTESEWVAQTLEACGHAVIVADPNYALMYGHRARRIKTDKRDVAALAEACRLGIYRAAHRVSAAQRAGAASGPDSGATGADADADDQSAARAAAAGGDPVGAGSGRDGGAAPRCAGAAGGAAGRRWRRCARCWPAWRRCSRRRRPTWGRAPAPTRWCAGC